MVLIHFIRPVVKIILSTKNKEKNMNGIAAWKLPFPVFW